MSRGRRAIAFKSLLETNADFTHLKNRMKVSIVFSKLKIRKELCAFYLNCETHRIVYEFEKEQLMLTF